MIKVNTATLDELMEAIHIGPVRAQLIINQRNERKFRDLYELSLIHGFAKKRINDIISEGKLKAI